MIGKNEITSEGGETKKMITNDYSCFVAIIMIISIILIIKRIK